MKRTKRTWIMNLAVGLLAGRLFGQGAQPTTTFEVASIKPAPPFSLEKMMSGQVHVGKISGSRVDFGFVSLADLLAYAYRVKPYQISGPAWIRDGRWDIDAKLPAGESSAHVPEMVLSLLVERFKLAAHNESRENQVYQLMVEKGGPKMKESPPEVHPAEGDQPDHSAAPSTFLLGGGLAAGSMRMNNGGAGAVITGGPNGTTRVSQSPNDGMRMEMSRMTMASLAGMLTPFLDRPVVDATGLKGEYQVALELPFDAMMRAIQTQAGAGAVQSTMAQWGGGGFGGARTGTAGAGADGASSGGVSDPSGPSIFRAVQQLGLKLQRGKAPIVTIVIDHLEKAPTGNQQGGSTMCIGQAADIFGAGVIAGTFVMGAVAVHPAAARLDPSMQVLLCKEPIPRLQRFLPPFMLLPVGASLRVLTLCDTHHSWPLDLAGCALSLATIGVTVAVNGRLNRCFARCSAETFFNKGLGATCPPVERRALHTNVDVSGCGRVRDSRSLLNWG